MSHILSEKLTLKYNSHFFEGILNLHLHGPKEYLQLFKCSAEWRYCGSWWIHLSTISMSLAPRFISSGSVLWCIPHIRMFMNIWVFLSNQDLLLVLTFLLLYHSSFYSCWAFLVLLLLLVWLGFLVGFVWVFLIFFSKYVVKKDYGWEGVYLKMHNKI